MNIQAPPNLSPGVYPKLIARRHQRLGRRVAGDAGSRQSRGAVAGDRGACASARPTPASCWCSGCRSIRPTSRDPRRWLGAGDRHAGAPLERRRGLGARRRLGAGRDRAPPAPAIHARCGRSGDRATSSNALTAGDRLDEPEIVRLFAARDADYRRVITAADELRRAVSGDTVRYVVNRNINYTNICYYRCKFCAFSKGKTHEALRGAPYDLELEEIVRRAHEAWDRGATEVCLQGGIHPRLHRRDLSRHLPGDQGGGAGDAHPRLLAAGGHAGRGDARDAAADVPGAS